LAAGAGVAVLASLVACSSGDDAALHRLSSAADAPTSSYTPFDRVTGEAQVVDCLQRDGIDASFDETGGVQMAGASSQDAAQKALGECEAKAGFPTLQDIDDDELAYLYRETVKERNCLIRHGQKLTSMPSWSEFKGSYLNDPYVPYAELRNLAPSKLMALEKVCPQPDL